MDALRIEQLTKTYASGTKALEGVSLRIEQGEFFALLGPNGAGKTTLIGTLVGLVNKTSGTVFVNDINLDVAAEKARTAIGIVPQELNFNIFEKTFDIVVNQAGYYGIPRAEAIPRAHELLDALGLADKKFERSMNLSGGMKRRLMIARALIHKPTFLILDEPTAGVDVELRRGMWDFLTKVNAEGVTILLTTHYLEEAEQLCKRAAIINKGKIIAEGSMKELLGRLKTERIILDLALPKGEEALRVVAAYNPSLVDSTTIEIEIGEGKGVSGAIVALDTAGIPVQTTRAKSGKLEEVFVNLTKETA